MARDAAPQDEPPAERMASRSSFWAQLGEDTFEGPPQVFQEVRQTMLQALRQCHMAQAPLLELDIRAAQDLAQLWYLRPRLLQVLTASAGARVAEEVLHRVADLFVGHFDQAIHSRFGGP